MKLYRVTLSKVEREFLTTQIYNGKYKKTRLVRAQILLGADEGIKGKCLTDEQISISYGVSIRTIERTRRRFVEEGFEQALHGRPRPVNRKKRIDGRLESHLIALRCSDPPKGTNRWTLRLLADKMVELGYIDSISHQSIDNTLKKLQLSLGESNPG